MANITPLTEKLKLFNDTVTPKLSSMDSEKNDISMYLNDAITSCDSAISGISSTIPDDQGKTAVKAMALIKDALEVMKTSITNDMGDILAECKKISEEIAVIEAEIARGNQLTPGFWENVWNEIVGFFTSHWCDNDAGEIKRINEKVEQSMKALEAQLDAIASSSAAIKLGIIGNMVSGGSLGSYVSFDSTYSFNIQAWKEANPIYHANIFGKTACFVVGQVEGAIKFFEGGVDAVLTAGATVVQGVGSVFGQDWSTNFLSEAAEFDIAGAATGWAYDGLKSIGQYDEGWRTAGNVVGQVTAAIVVSAIPGVGPGAAFALGIASAGGQAAEASLQSGNSSATAFLHGGAAAGVAWATGAVFSKIAGCAPVQKVVSKASSWLAGGSKAANMLTGAGEFVGEVVNVVTKPAQWTTRGIIASAKAVGSKVTPVASAVAGKLGQGWNKVQNSKLGQGAKNTWNKVQNSKLGQGAKNAWNKMTHKTTAGGNMSQSADDYAAKVIKENTVPQTKTVSEIIDEATGVTRATPANKITAESSMFSSMDDAALKAYQTRNGIQTTDDFVAQVIRENTVPQTKNLAGIVDDATGVTRATPANKITSKSSMFSSIDDETFRNYRRKNGTYRFEYEPSGNYSYTDNGAVNHAAGKWEKAQLAYEANPTEANYKFAKDAYDNLVEWESWDASAYQARNNTLKSLMPNDEVNASLTVDFRDIHDAFGVVDDATFNAYQARNGIQTTDDFAAQIIRENTVPQTKNLAGIVDDMTGVNGTAGKLPTAETSMFSSMDDATFNAYQARNGLQGTDDVVRATSGQMDDLASRGVPEPQFEQTNWDMYDPARTPGRTGTEVGYIENGEFVSGYSASNGQQITAENSMFANASNKQFKGYQHRNGLNKNQLPPV